MKLDEPAMITVETDGITAACKAAFEQGRAYQSGLDEKAVKILEASLWGMENNDWCGELADGNCMLDDDCESATADAINDCIRSGCPYQDIKKAIAALREAGKGE